MTGSGTMTANIVFPEQKKRNNQGCDITKYFSPSTKVVHSIGGQSASGTEDIPDYFKRHCAPLDLSQPTVFPRSSVHNDGGEANPHVDLSGKWTAKDDPRCADLNYKDDVGMDRFERQIFQELDSRMCQELDAKVVDDEDITNEQRMYDAMGEPQNSLMTLPETIRQQQQQQHQQPERPMLDEKSSPGMANAYDAIMADNRAINTQEMCPAMPKEPPSSCGNYLYAESQAYKWVPELPAGLDEVKSSNVQKATGPEMFIEADNPSLEEVIPLCIKEPTLEATRPAFPSTTTTTVPETNDIEVISYEDFLKSEGLSVPSKDKPAEPESATAEPPVAKKQSNIRRFFTRVPRTVEVKFDHKRLVTVTAVVHPQPQSPRKLPPKKTNYKRQSPRRPPPMKATGRGGGDAKQTSYNTRQRKSNVVVDMEEIDQSIEEMCLEKVTDKPVRRRFKRNENLQDRNENKRQSCYTPVNNNKKNALQNGADDRWVLRPRADNTTKNRKSARLNPQLEESPQVGAANDVLALRSHKPLRSIYKSTVVQKDAYGLRLRLTRIGRKHHRHRHRKHKSAKLQRAMQLLQKAKESSVPRDSLLGVRRSPRQSSVIVRKAMEGAERAEQMRQARISAQRVKSSRKRMIARRCLRMNNARNETTTQSQLTLRSSVQTGSKPKLAKKPATVEKGNAKKDVENKQKPIMDPSSIKAKQDFLQSGVPESIQISTIKSTGALNPNSGLKDFSPFPRVSHVQQKEMDRSPWNLSAVDGQLKRKMKNCGDDSAVEIKLPTGDSVQLGILASISGKVSECYKSQVDKLASFNSISKRLPSSLVKHLLKEVALRFPNFCAFKLYQRYKWKLRKAQKCDDLDTQTSLNRGTDSKKRSLEAIEERLAKKHRRNIEVNEVDKDGVKDEWNPLASKLGFRRDCHWQWTEKYQPTHSADLIGNGRAVRHLRQWLVEWRDKCKLEAKQQQQPKLVKKDKGSWDDDDGDDSDFVMSDANDDSNLDDGRLCNTMLISGPSGIGKTAAVYALADELGYKIFEVNATSKRVGKQILAQLQETTQSHQVLPKNKPIKCFFETKKVASQDGSQPKMETKAARKEYSQDSPPVAISLVLFEDVDLSFEDDDGFIQAINTFMATTKRPIILTTSNCSFTSNNVKGNCEELKFDVPSAALTATYLQVLCLAENIQTEFEDIARLVEFNRGDVRRSLMELQYWLLSGGDPWASDDNAPRSNAKLKWDEESQDGGKNVGRHLEEPDSTMISLMECLQEESSTDSGEDKTERIPAVHRGSFQQIHGISVPLSIPLLASMQTADVKTLTLLVEQCRSLGISLSLSNLPHMLSLPTSRKMSTVSESLSPETDVKNCRERAQFKKEVCGNTISALARLQDNLSWLDAMLHEPEGTPSVGCWKWWYREPMPSELDKPPDEGIVCGTNREWEIHASVEAASMWTCSQALQKTLRNVALHENEGLTYMTVPAEESFVSHDLEVDPKLCSKHLECARTLEECLPSVLGVSRRNLVVDYFPFVRGICQSETLRQATNTKRGGRFLHYLDALSIPPAVVRHLSEDFP